jgi:hypothetical protein
MVRSLTPIAIAGMVVVLAGCAAQVEDEPAPEQSAPVEPDVSEPVEDTAESSDPLEGVNLVECNDTEREAVSLPITQQTEAFGAGDFDTAYSMASPSFRAAVPQGVFEQLIASSYGPLLRSADLIFDSCLIERDLNFATIDARFNQGGLDVFGLRYVVSETDEGWRVDGASDLEVVGAGT